MSVVDFKKLTVPALKAELTKLGIDASGLKKADLIAKLEEATAAAKRPAAPAKSDAPATADSPSLTAATITSPSKQPTSPSPSAVASAAPASSAPPASSPSTSSASSNFLLPAAAGKTGSEDKPPQGGEAAELIAARKRRAEKFGTTFSLTEDEKKKAREARFGPTKKNGEATANVAEAATAATGLEPKAKKTKTGKGGEAPSLSAEELDKLSKRASKFGTGTPQPILDAAETEKRLKRAARFSNPSSSPPAGPTAASATTSVPAASLTAQ